MPAPEIVVREFKDLINRPIDSKKYDYGHLLIVGGSRQYTGAIIFNALAAYIGGIDLVTIAAPKRAADIAAAYAPDIIAVPIDCDYLSDSQYNTIRPLVEKKVSTLLVGSGMGRKKKTFDLVKKLHENLTNIPFIFDADALYCVHELKLREYDLLIPNIREFGVLSKGEMPNKKTVEELACKLGCTILAKGSTDYVASPGKLTKDVPDKSKKSVYLAKGGTGDLLAGLCASFIGQGIPVYDSALLGARVMKSAGILIGKDKGPFYLPSELLGYVQQVLVKEM
ncbi:MAG: NAD(P)H-hydrate dehydratase [Candidatus Micrarchaeia archaeon]